MNHHILLKYLASMGLGGNFMLCLWSYFDWMFSECGPLWSLLCSVAIDLSVSLGPFLSPLLFNIYVKTLGVWGWVSSLCWCHTALHLLFIKDCQGTDWSVRELLCSFRSLGRNPNLRSSSKGQETGLAFMCVLSLKLSDVNSGPSKLVNHNWNMIDTMQPTVRNAGSCGWATWWKPHFAYTYLAWASMSTQSKVVPAQESVWVVLALPPVLTCYTSVTS